ncbi:MAG: M56 family metallopeptidase [bacterium]
MIDTLSSTALAWLVTYAIHSTVLLSLAWVLVRARRLSPAAIELVWKSAMIGSIITATVQLELDVRPVGTVSLRAASVTNSAPARAPHVGLPSTDSDESVGVLHETSQDAATPTTSPVNDPVITNTPISRTAVVVSVWALIALVLAVSYAARRLILTGRIGDRHAILDGPLFDMLNTLANNNGVRPAPRLTSTPRISSPIALGVREICVPETALTALDLEQQRSMLAHELAHLARRDPVWMALASLVERVLWIQPLNRVARRQMATAAEYICDDWAVRRTGSGVALARCLAQVAEWIQASPLGVPVAGMAEERSLLVSRVARLLDGARPASRSKRLLAVGAVLVLLATVAFAPGASVRPARASAVNTSSLLGSQTPRSSQSDAQRDSSRAVEAELSALTAIDSHAFAKLAGMRNHSVATPADSAVIIALIARLKDEDAEVRAAAAHSLGRLEDPRAVPGLIDALKDAKANVRSAAAEALGEFKDTRAITPLVALLSDTNAEVKKHALEALSNYEQGVPSAGIVKLLDDSDADIRHTAAHLVGQLHDRSASGALAKLIHDSNSDVRQAAIEALGEMHDQTSATAILAALADTDADVRGQALNTLSELRTPIPEATLLTLLRDPKPDVRGRAAEIAGARSVIGTIPRLRQLLDDPNGDVRQHAVEALGNIADASASEALRAALGSKDAKVRRAAAEALGERRQ